MMRRSSCLLAAALAVLVPNPLPHPALAQTARFTDAVEVVTVNVDVVVTYRGEPISDLGVSDFEILEDGEPREVTNFARVTDGAVFLDGEAEPTPVEADARFRPKVVVLFDLNGTQRPQLARATDAALAYLEARAGEAIDWSVAVVGVEPEVVLPFSGDTDRVRSALRSVAERPTFQDLRTVDRRAFTDPLRSQMLATEADATAGGGSSASLGARSALETLYNFAGRAETRQQLQRLALLARGLVDILRASASAPGKKACLLFTGNLDFGAQVLVDTRPLSDNRAQRYALDTIDLQRQVQEVASEMARLANTAGFTIYTLSGGLRYQSLEIGADGSARGDLRDETSGPSSLDPRSPTADWDSVPRMLSEGTGGTHLTGNDLSAELERVHRRLSTYYSLGFRSSTSRSGAHRRIEVRVSRRGARVEHRPGRYDLAPEQVLVEQLTAPLQLQQSRGAIPVQAAAYGMPSEGRLLVRATVGATIADLAFLPGEDSFAGELGIHAAVYDPAGRAIDLRRATQRVEIPSSLWEAVQSTPITSVVELDLEPGDYTVSLAVFDRVAGLWGLALTPIQPGPPPPGPESPAVAPPGVSVPVVQRHEAPPVSRPAATPEAAHLPSEPAPSLSPELAAWPDGPEGVLLTEGERRRLALLSADDAVLGFISLFWARRDPDPEAPGNPVRDEFERRVTAADQRFAEPGTRGALTPRGRALILLGPPDGRTHSADLRRDTWYYERDHLPPGAMPKKTPKTLRLQFALGEDGVWAMADPDSSRQELAEEILRRTPASLIAHPELSEVPIPPLFLTAEAADERQLGWLTDARAGFPEGTVAAAHPEVFPGHVPHSWVFVRLPHQAPQCDAMVGLVLDPDRQPVGSFRLPARPRISALGTAYGVSVPVPSTSATLRLALASGEVPVASFAVPLEVPLIPPSATWVSEPIAGAEILQQSGFTSWSTPLFGGYELIPRPLGRYASDETLHYFCHIIRPGATPGRPPRVDVRMRVIRGDTVIAESLVNGVELSAMAADTFLLASTLPLASLPGPGSYQLELQVVEPTSGVSRTAVLPLDVE